MSWRGAADRGDLPRLGSVFGRYRLDALLGRGGMGVVMHAVDLALERPVAIKFLSPELASDPDFRERFVRESRMAAAIEHPAIVPIYEAGSRGESLYIVMRYVPGQDLGRILRLEAPLEVERTLALVEPIAEALDVAHQRGLIHRDVKPGNILVERSDRERALLTDFGLSRRAGDATLTLGSGPLGTIDYVAPEQVQGSEVDGRADQYALACVVLHCLTGRPPFEAPSAVGVLYAQVHAAPPNLRERRPDLPAALGEPLERALSKDPAKRFETCAAFAAGLRAAVPSSSASVPGASAPGVTEPARRKAEGAAADRVPSPRRRGWRAGLLGAATAAGVGLVVVAALIMQPQLSGEVLPDATPTLPTRAADALELQDREIIVFASDRDGDYDLYALRAGDGQPRRLGRDTAQDERSPAISPDGSTVAYVVGRETARDIWIMDSDGSRPRALVAHPADDLDPAWSSDGRRLAFASDRSDPMYDIWEIRLAAGPAGRSEVNGRPRNLTARPALEHYPAWIPGSTDLVIASNQAGGNRDLWRIGAADRGQLRRLTSTDDFDFKAAVAPGGRRMAFYRRELCTTCPRERGAGDIMLADITGREARRIGSRSARDETDPAWAPDERAIAYTAGGFRTASGPLEDAELMVTTPDGRRDRRLTRGWAHVAEPSWGRLPLPLEGSPSSRVSDPPAS